MKSATKPPVEGDTSCKLGPFGSCRRLWTSIVPLSANSVITYTVEDDGNILVVIIVQKFIISNYRELASYIMARIVCSLISH